YSVARPEALTLWEAQFGDFVNGAQSVIDEYISSGETKWGQKSGVVLLLPHGYEGQGPDHSSARIERFLALAANGEITIAQPSTSASYFHLLRRQALESEHRPLIVFTPKQLLRRKSAASDPAEFTSGEFRPVIADTDVEAGSVERVILASGRVTHDLLEARTKREDTRTAILRVEQLYPRPLEEVKELLAQYSNLTTVRWVQDEPSNQGPWPHYSQHWDLDVPLELISRPESSTTAVGSKHRHDEEASELMDAAFAG
ncbi:MAG: multifunctional oxoglutarate decarboxylase/oxoglutarate dehydrogenase thiamine pyrophosphate-binding subunit/dihydrolipoyllysine-residue succinyltransferase subunit, partial [Actinomycetales bacterium]